MHIGTIFYICSALKKCVVQWLESGISFATFGTSALEIPWASSLEKASCRLVQSCVFAGYGRGCLVIDGKYWWQCEHQVYSTQKTIYTIHHQSNYKLELQHSMLHLAYVCVYESCTYCNYIYIYTSTCSIYMRVCQYKVRILASWSG